MIRALAGGVAPLPGLIGVTRLIEIGTLTVEVALLALAPEPVPMVTTTVPVKVPFGRPVGSPRTCRVTPAGVSDPLDGCTLSHGLSTVATKGNVPSGKPGMKTICTTLSVLPAGTLGLGIRPRGGAPARPGATPPAFREGADCLLRPPEA